MTQMRRQSLVAYGAPLCETIIQAPRPQGGEVLVRVDATRARRRATCHCIATKQADGRRGCSPAAANRPAAALPQPDAVQRIVQYAICSVLGHRVLESIDPWIGG
jgi:hypothetical protein